MNGVMPLDGAESATVDDLIQILMQASSMFFTLEHRDAEVGIESLLDGRTLVTVKPRNEALFVPSSQWTTSYPIELIQLILEVRGPADLCDEMMRDENPAYVEQDLTRDLYAYFDDEDFANKRILDFGCGAGASTAILARMFPSATIVGVDLKPGLISVARERMKYYGLPNVMLRVSPRGTELPPDLGTFDFVMMSAVYEHLLPDERTILMPKIWDLIGEGGHLFINQTPNLLCPVEGHTTGLPLLNYIPRRLALELARRVSKRVERDESWTTLLRKGIRGATEREIMRNLSLAEAGTPLLMEPTRNGLHDRVDLWYSALNQTRLKLVKRGLKVVMKAMWYGLGATLMPNLTLIIQKQRV